MCKNQKRSLNPSLCLVDTHTSSCCTARGDNMTHVWELLSAVVCAAACSPLLTLRCSDSGVNPVSRTLVFAGSHNWHKEPCFMLSWLFKQMWLLGLLVLLCFARVDRETVGEQQQRRSAQSGKSLVSQLNKVWWRLTVDLCDRYCWNCLTNHHQYRL